MFKPEKIIELENKRKASDKKFTYSKILKFIPLTPPSYSAIKEGRSIPKANILERIAIFYGVDMNYFFEMEIDKLTEEKFKVTGAIEYILTRYERLVEENKKLNTQLKEVSPNKEYAEDSGGLKPKKKKTDHL